MCQWGRLSKVSSGMLCKVWYHVYQVWKQKTIIRYLWVINICSESIKMHVNNKYQIQDSDYHREWTRKQRNEIKERNMAASSFSSSKQKNNWFRYSKILRYYKAGWWLHWCSFLNSLCFSVCLKFFTWKKEMFWFYNMQLIMLLYNNRNLLLSLS